jgi:hypothetical protein
MEGSEIVDIEHCKMIEWEWERERERKKEITELRSLKASATCFSEAPPPTSKKFAGDPEIT